MYTSSSTARPRAGSHLSISSSVQARSLPGDMSMAGADGHQELTPLRDLIARRAASFLRMARLALAGAAAPAKLHAEEEVAIDAGDHGAGYAMVSAEDDAEADGGAGTEAADEPEARLLAAVDGERGGGRPQPTGLRVTNTAQELRRRPAPSRAENAAAAEEAEPLVMPCRRRGARRDNGVGGPLDHPFGYDRRAGESSSLLVLY